MSCKGLRTLVITIVLMAGTVAPSHAQGARATLSGVVTDESAAVVAGATVTTHARATNQERTTVTDSAGRFVLPNLPTGEHVVLVEFPGFHPESRAVALSVGQDLEVAVVLGVAALAEVVQVTGERTVGVETRTSTLGHLVTRTQIESQPLNARDFSTLVLFLPGAVQARSDQDDIIMGKGTKVSVHGARTNQNLFLLDGTDILDALGRSSGSAQGIVSGIEAVEEFTVLTNTFGAEFGRASGGVFNIASRAGSNTFRGSAFELFRNDVLNARNFFETEKQPFVRHQFGGAGGGPVVKNRLFWFGSYEGFRETRTLTDVQPVPSMAARRGEFLPPGARIAPAVLPYLDLIPLPTLDNPTGETATYVGTFRQPSNLDTYNLRLDYVLSERDSILARYTRTDSDILGPTADTFPQFPNGGDNGQRFLTLGETRVFSPTVVNSFRFAVNETYPREAPRPVDGYESLAFIPGQRIGDIAIGGYKRVGTDRNAPRAFHQEMIQIANDLTMTRGLHTLKVGMNIQRFDVDGVSASRDRGEFTFNTFSDFLLARSRDFVGLVPGQDDTRRHHLQWLLGFYGQDDWRVADAWTLNLGLRYEFFTVPEEVDGKTTNVRYPTDDAVTVGPPLFENSSLLNLAPRVGVVYVPTPRRRWSQWLLGGDRGTSVRAAIGVYYEPALYSTYGNVTFKHPPYFTQVRITGAPFPEVYPLLESGQGLVDTFAIEYDPDRTSVLQYNVNVQRALGRWSTLTVGYVGARGHNLWREADFNIAEPLTPDGSRYPPVARPARRNPNFSNIRYKMADGASAYDALQIGWTGRRPDFQGQISYTLAKSIDDQSGSQGRLEFANGQARSVDPYNLRLNRGRSDFDVRQNLSVSLAYGFPFGSGQRFASSSGLLNALFGGWRIAGTLTALSGIPVSPIFTFDQDRDGTTDNEQRPDLAGGARIQQVSRTQLFDPSVFVLPPVGSRGTVGRNVIDGPGLATLDLSLMKDLRHGPNGRPSIQFRLDAFNALNRTNFAIPTVGNLTVFNSPTERNPTAGRITGTGTAARQLQLGLRVSF